MPLGPGSTEPPTFEAAPLATWEPPHPVTRALLAGELPWPEGGATSSPRSSALAEALATTNRRWGNPAEQQLAAWLAGAKAVVTGQQPGLLGGPLLSLVKACAVAAEVAKLRAAGEPAVGFFWLETRDDDLPEMGWARVAVGGQLREAQEPWQRGACCAWAARLSQVCQQLLDTVQGEGVAEAGKAALELARETFSPGASLGEACGRFFGELLRPLGLVLVDPNLPELARASQSAATRLLQRLPEAWDALEARATQAKASGLPAPLRLAPQRLPLFRLEGGRRHPVEASHLAQVLGELAKSPEAFTPNVWLRPLLQDAALGTYLAILGSGELAYHWQAQDLWELAGLPRPRWQLRAHVTLVTGGERRGVEKLGLEPADLLRRALPRRVLPLGSLERELAAMARQAEARLARFAAKAAGRLPALSGDVEATRQRLRASYGWLGERLALRREELAAVERNRFARLATALRPRGKPQERALSVVSPLLQLGLELPGLLAQALTALPAEPAMYLLYWRRGGLW
jgi:uncharacterized protein YllA (UPF0747 family)